MSLTSTARSRLFFFGALYFAQGVPWGFITVPLQTYMTGQGMGPKEIGSMISLAYMPWAFKPLLGPLTDAIDLGRLGRRRPWILGAEIGMGVTLLILAGLDLQGAMPLFLGLIFAHNAFAAAQDVGVDALAVEMLGEEERSKANGVMWAAKYAGVMAGGGGLAMIASALGWRWLFLVMAALMFTIAILPALAREPPRPRPPPHARARLGRLDWAIHVAAGLAVCGLWPVYTWAGGKAAIWYVVAIGVAAAVARTFLPGATPLRNRVLHEALRSFAVRAAFVGLVLYLLAPAAASFLSPLSIPLLKNRIGYSDTEIAQLTGIYSPLLGAAGALAGGFLAARLDRRWAIALFTAAGAGLYAAFGGLSSLWGDRAFVYGFNLASAFVEGMIQAVYLSLAMDLSNPAVGGTQFTVYMGAQNLKNSWTSWTGGVAAEALPAPAMYLLGAAVGAAPLLLLPLVNPAEAKRAFRKDEQISGIPVA